MDGGNADFAGAKICLTRPTLMHKKTATRAVLYAWR